MTDRIEETLKGEILAETPDILADLLQECGFGEDAPGSDLPGEEEQPEVFLQQAENFPQESAAVIDIRSAGRKKLFRIIGGTAAAVFLVAAGFSLYHFGVKHGAEQEQIRYSAEQEAQENAEKTGRIGQAAEAKEEKTPFAVVSLDVNPSVEMTVDDAGHVLTWTAVNPEAEEILKGLDLAGSDIKVAAYALVGAMLTRGYLNEDVNSVLVSVVSADEKKGLELERELSESLNTYLEDSVIHAAVFGQYAGDDETVKQFAAAHELSYGKAWLIRALLSEDPQLEEDSLLKLSTQELLLLWERQPEEQTQENRTVYGSVSVSRYILPGAALQTALTYAGLTEEDIADPSTEIGCEDGIIIYEVEFLCGGREYEIDVDAVSGEIIGSEMEPAPRPDEQFEPVPEPEDDPDGDEYDPDDDDHDDLYDGDNAYDDDGREDADDYYEEEDQEDSRDDDDNDHEDDDDDDDDNDHEDDDDDDDDD